MRQALAGIGVVAVLALARQSASTPAPCFHGWMRGGLFSAASPALTSPVRLSARLLADQGGLSLSGHLRCKPSRRDPQRCTGTGTDAAVQGHVLSTSPFGDRFAISVQEPREPFRVLCELETSVPAFTRAQGCLGGLMGTYVCHDGDLETDRGSFGLVGTCGPC